MRIGVLVLQARPWAELEHEFQKVEELGFDVAYAADHLSHPTMAGQWLGDCWTTLAAAAACTGRIELGSLVASAAIRNPVSLARAVATVQDISGNRVVLGLGAGTSGDVAADRAAAFSSKHLSQRYAEVVEALDLLWRSGASWQGEHVGLDGVETAPLPAGASRPYLLLAAHGARGFDLVATYADGWSTYGGPAAASLSEPEFWSEVEQQSAAVTRACEAVSRDPAGLRRSVLVGFGMVRPFASVDSFLATMATAEEKGFDEVVLYWPLGEEGARFWADPEVVSASVEAWRSQRGAGPPDKVAVS